MRRINHQADDTGQDSFLDVVANVVGVLIILVMVVGVQASRSVVTTSKSQSAKSHTPRPSTTESQNENENLATLRTRLNKERKAVRSVERSLEKLVMQVVNLSGEAEAQNKRRIELAMHRSVIEEDLEQRRARLDEQSQRDFDVQRDLVEKELELEELNREQMALLASAPVTEEIECIPTPLAKTVEDKAIHLRVSNGLVSIVPLEEMLEEVQYYVEDVRRRLRESNKVVQTIGPINGYRLRLTVIKRYAQQGVVGPRLGEPRRVKIGQFAEFIPTSEEIGQNVEQSLMPGGALYDLLRKHRRDKPAVVVWLYTDSFQEYRPLKRALWEQGFSVATRPMRPGAYIGASPEGTKAAAQ